MATNLQIDSSKAGTSASSPSAITPDGTTTTDTFSHVKVAEKSTTDVTTSFIGSTVVEKSNDKMSTFSPPSYISAMSTDFILTLKKALCRPLAIATGSWATTDAVSANLKTGNLPEDLLSLSIVSRKLDGFQGIRGSITLRLQATGNPFQQGRLKLLWYPMADEDPTYPFRTTNPLSWTFWPSVDLDLGVETACELRVPFLLPVSFCDLVTSAANERPQMGRYFVKVYSPLQVGAGSNTVGWNLYAHWNEDDLQLINPSLNSFQSGSTKKLTESHKSVGHGHSGPPAEAEKKTGSISGALTVGAHVADLATAVPVLADFAGPTAWALRCAARVASALGFSRFPIDEKPKLTTDYEMPYGANVEGPDVSLPLSLTIEPSLKFEPTLSGKNEDEMALDYFLTKLGYATVINLTTSDAAAANKLTIVLGPFSTFSGEATCPKPYQMLAKMFQFWRGNYVIRFKFVKTKMHTARLCFAFFPGQTGALTLANTEYVHRDIVDISSVDELIYELPFTSPFPYLNTGSSDRTGVYGTLQVFVVNPLQAPSSVASNINIIVEMGFGPGAEFYCPRVAFSSLPVAQAGETNGLVRVSMLSDAKTQGPQVETAQLCVGEKLMSLRQIIKYTGSLAHTKQYVNTTTDATGFIAPLYYQPSCIGASTSAGALSAFAGDFLNLLAPYYRFSRGSMRVRGIVKASAPNNFNSDAAILSAYCTVATGNGLNGIDGAATAIPFGGDMNIKPNRVFKLLLPPWQTCPVVPLNYVLSNTSPSTALYRNTQALKIAGYTDKLSTVYSVFLSRQPADDYELIGFLGPPIVVTPVSEASPADHSQTFETRSLPQAQDRFPLPIAGNAR